MSASVTFCEETILFLSSLEEGNFVQQVIQIQWLKPLFFLAHENLT